VLIDCHHHDPDEHGELTEQDLAIAALVGRYIERREHQETPCVHDLLAAATEFGDAAVDVLRTLLACYEAMRAYGDRDPRPSGNPAASATQLRSTL
jgi:hypothetical protein